jgi:hypothetical protein
MEGVVRCVDLWNLRSNVMDVKAPTGAGRGDTSRSRESQRSLGARTLLASGIGRETNACAGRRYWCMYSLLFCWAKAAEGKIIMYGSLL